MNLRERMRVSEKKREVQGVSVKHKQRGEREGTEGEEKAQMTHVGNQ